MLSIHKLKPSYFYRNLFFSVFQIFIFSQLFSQSLKETDLHFIETLISNNEISTYKIDKYFNDFIFLNDQSPRNLLMECAGHKLNTRSKIKVTKSAIDSCKLIYKPIMNRNDSINLVLFQKYLMRYGWPLKRCTKTEENYLIIFNHCNKDVLDFYFPNILEAKKNKKIPYRFFKMFFDRHELLNCRTQKYGSYKCRDETNGILHLCQPSEFSKKCKE